MNGELGTATGRSDLVRLALRLIVGPRDADHRNNQAASLTVWS